MGGVRSRQPYAWRGPKQKSPSGGFEPKPARGEHSQKMPARKNQHIALDCAHPTHNMIGPRANMIRQFSTGTAIAKQLPVGTVLMDLDRSETFVISVVPFG